MLIKKLHRFQYQKTILNSNRSNYNTAAVKTPSFTIIIHDFFRCRYISTTAHLWHHSRYCCLAGKSKFMRYVDLTQVINTYQARQCPFWINKHAIYETVETLIDFMLTGITDWPDLISKYPLSYIILIKPLLFLDSWMTQNESLYYPIQEVFSLICYTLIVL